jgi:DNA repair exonuclease SbcCD ATPase subunit
MTIQTIETIRSLRKEIKNSLALIKISDFDGQTFGPESEYTAKGLIAGLNALLIDLLSLTKAPAKFVKFSTHAERKSIQNVLTNINNAVVSKNIPNLATYVDQIKPLIWRYGVRHSDERQQNLDTVIDELQKRTVEFEERLKDLEEISEKFDNQVSFFSDIADKNKLISEELEELSTKFHESLESLSEDRESISNFIDIDKERFDEIAELLSEAKSNSGLIENFINRVEKRENQLEKQEAVTEEFLEKLEEFTKERTDLLNEAMELIESAKIALEYKTAEGLSAAFMEKYSDSKNDTSLNNWIYGAVSFVVIALGVGVWILAGKTPDYRVVLGRISLLPTQVSGLTIT